MRKSPFIRAVVALVALGTVAGCTAVSARPTPTPVRTFTPVIYSGDNVGGKVMQIPDGARSATITVVCSGGRSYSLDGVFPQNLGGVSGGCDSGIHSYERSVVARQTLDLEIQLSDVGSFVVETRFSPDRFAIDPEISTQCSTISTAESDVDNAEQGFSLGALTRVQWQQKVTDAANALTSLDPEKPNILSGPLAVMRAALLAKQVSPGSFTGSGAEHYRSSLNIVSYVCADSGVPIAIMADYGG